MIWLVGIEKNVGEMSHLAKHVIIPACNLKTFRFDQVVSEILGGKANSDTQV